MECDAYQGVPFSTPRDRKPPHKTPVSPMPMRTFFCCCALIVSARAYSQEQGSVIIRLDEFRRSLGDKSRSIYMETTSPDSLLGPISFYFASKFYLEDSSYIARDLVKGSLNRRRTPVVEHFTSVGRSFHWWSHRSNSDLKP